MEISDNQIKALKYLILKSKDAGLETKKICFALIDGSEGLTKSVFFTCNSKDAQYGLHDMVSSNGTTHLQEIMKSVGTEMIFSNHGGYFDAEGIFNSHLKEGEDYTHTLWLSKNRYDKTALELTKECVEKIVLKDPLYNF